MAFKINYTTKPIEFRIGEYVTAKDDKWILGIQIIGKQSQPLYKAYRIVGIHNQGKLLELAKFDDLVDKDLVKHVPVNDTTKYVYYE